VTIHYTSHVIKINNPVTILTISIFIKMQYPQHMVYNFHKSSFNVTKIASTSELYTTTLLVFMKSLR